MARTRWPPDLGPRPLAQDGQIGTAPPVGATKTWDPADESLARQPARASADSEVRPGPRPPTLCPYYRKTTQAGPEALPPILPADSERLTRQLTYRLPVAI